MFALKFFPAEFSVQNPSTVSGQQTGCCVLASASLWSLKHYPMLRVTHWTEDQRFIIIKPDMKLTHLLASDLILSC